MPSLSTGLHSLWSSQGAAASQGNAFSEQGAEHSLFSGTPNLLGFPQSQLRQQSRFQFAQELAPGMAFGAGGHPEQVVNGPLTASHSMYQQQAQSQQQQQPLQQQQAQQQHQASFRQDAPYSHEATHPFASQQAASGYHGFPGQSSNGETSNDIYTACCLCIHVGFSVIGWWFNHSLIVPTCQKEYARGPLKRLQCCSLGSCALHPVYHQR